MTAATTDEVANALERVAVAFGERAAVYARRTVFTCEDATCLLRDLCNEIGGISVKLRRGEYGP